MSFFVVYVVIAVAVYVAGNLYDYYEGGITVRGLVHGIWFCAVWPGALLLFVLAYTSLNADKVVIKRDEK